jgi:hypothetical protein
MNKQLDIARRALKITTQSLVLLGETIAVIHAMGFLASLLGVF